MGGTSSGGFRPGEPPSPMIVKRLLRPERLRQVPPSFSWVDHRLVGQNLIRHCGHRALALYLFLVTVGDVQGLSYYSDASIGRRLQFSPDELAQARDQLIRADLIAHHAPLYQVLALDADPAPPAAQTAVPPRGGEARSAAAILRQVLQSAGGAS
jgi:hypothetical protein